MEHSEDKENQVPQSNLDSLKNIQIEQTKNPESKMPEIKLEAGTIIKFKGLKGKKEFNGRFGVVKKQLENGRFQVMIDGDKDLSMKKVNLEPLDQCPNEHNLVEEGMLFWPHVKGCPTPCIQWLNDDVLEKAFVNPFGKNSPFLRESDRPKPDESEKSSEPKKKNEKRKREDDETSKNREFVDDITALTKGNFDRFRNYDRSWMYVEQHFKSDHQKRKQVMAKYESRLKELLNWKTPTPWIKTILTDFAVENQVCIYYDKDSEGAANDWLQIRFQQLRVPIPEINGPFVLVNFLHKPQMQETSEVINYHKAIYHISKYHGQPLRSLNFCSQEDKKMKKYGNDLHKIMDRIATENVCNKPDCDAGQDNFKYMNEMGERYGVDPSEIRDLHVQDEMMRKRCEEEGVDYEDLLKKMVEEAKEKNPEMYEAFMKKVGKGKSQVE